MECRRLGREGKTAWGDQNRLAVFFNNLNYSKFGC